MRRPQTPKPLRRCPWIGTGSDSVPSLGRRAGKCASRLHTLPLRDMGVLEPRRRIRRDYSRPESQQRCGQQSRRAAFDARSKTRWPSASHLRRPAQVGAGLTVQFRRGLKRLVELTARFKPDTGLAPYPVFPTRATSAPIIRRVHVGLWNFVARLPHEPGEKASG
jgi:hypothetical protein